jgi:hypothetical protein
MGRGFSGGGVALSALQIFPTVFSLARGWISACEITGICAMKKRRTDDARPRHFGTQNPRSGE